MFFTSSFSCPFFFSSSSSSSPQRIRTLLQQPGAWKACILTTTEKYILHRGRGCMLPMQQVAVGAHFPLQPRYPTSGCIESMQHLWRYQLITKMVSMHMSRSALNSCLVRPISLIQMIPMAIRNCPDSLSPSLSLLLCLLLFPQLLVLLLFFPSFSPPLPPTPPVPLLLLSPPALVPPPPPHQFDYCYCFVCCRRDKRVWWHSCFMIVGTRY